MQIICARLTLSRPPHTPQLTGGAGHQLDGIRLHFSSKSQPIRGCFYAEDNLAIGCKWKDGANALAPVRTAPKHQRLFSEKTLRKTLKDPGSLNRVHSLNQKILFKIKFHHHTMLKIFAKKTTTYETCCELPHNKLTSAPNPWVARLVFSTNRITSDCFGLAEGEKELLELWQIYSKSWENPWNTGCFFLTGPPLKMSLDWPPPKFAWTGPP